MTKTAFIFHGQGSQSVGMLDELSNRHPIIIEMFDLVSDRLGYNLWELVQRGPESILNQTERTQVAMLTADVAIFRLLQQQGLAKVDIMAGHSLGEYAALVCADAISLPDAATLVATRGQLMQEAVPLGQGAMAAIIGLSDAEVESVCEKVSTTGEMVNPANYNAVGQVVIAGHTQAVEKAIVLLEQQGARMAKIIPVSVPCHCALLKEAALSFADSLEKAQFKVPEIPVISNVDLSIYQSTSQIRLLLKEQLYHPVRWVETIQFMQKSGVELIVECGPGKVLSGLVKRIEKSIPTLNVGDLVSFDAALAQLLA